MFNLLIKNFVRSRLLFLFFSLFLLLSLWGVLSSVNLTNNIAVQNTSAVEKSFEFEVSGLQDEKTLDDFFKKYQDEIHRIYYVFSLSDEGGGQIPCYAIFRGESFPALYGSPLTEHDILTGTSKMLLGFGADLAVGSVFSLSEQSFQIVGKSSFDYLSCMIPARALSEISGPARLRIEYSSLLFPLQISEWEIQIRQDLGFTGTFTKTPSLDNSFLAGLDPELILLTGVSLLGMVNLGVWFTLLLGRNRTFFLACLISGCSRKKMAGTVLGAILLLFQPLFILCCLFYHFLFSLFEQASGLFLLLDLSIYFKIWVLYNLFFVLIFSLFIFKFFLKTPVTILTDE